MESPPSRARPVAEGSPDASSDLVPEIVASAEAAKSRPLTVAALMSYAHIPTVSEFARRARVSRNTVYRWMRTGLDVYTADELAVRVAHAHPACAFGHAWFTGCSAAACGSVTGRVS